jgi:hypothetical protein
MTETAINYLLVELDRKLRDLEFFSKEQGISLGAAKKTSELHKQIIELVSSFTTDKLSVEKLQEQLNSKVKALTEIRRKIEEHNQIYDLSVETALLLEEIDALAAIGGDDD